MKEGIQIVDRITKTGRRKENHPSLASKMNALVGASTKHLFLLGRGQRCVQKISLFIEDNDINADGRNRDVSHDMGISYPQRRKTIVDADTKDSHGIKIIIDHDGTFVGLEMLYQALL